MTQTRIATLEFPLELQIDFAKLSGDWNPMHMDNVAARRTAAGRLVVHGMHTVLRALESLAASLPGLPVPSRLTARFLKPVYVDDSVDILQVPCNDKELHLQALVDGVMVTDVRVNLGDFYGGRENLESCYIDDQVICRDLSLPEMRRRSGSIPLAATLLRSSSVER